MLLAESIFVVAVGAIPALAFEIVRRSSKSLLLAFSIPHQRHPSRLVIIKRAKRHLASEQKCDRLVWHRSRRDWDTQRKGTSRVSKEPATELRNLYLIRRISHLWRRLLGKPRLWSGLLNRQTIPCFREGVPLLSKLDGS